jgi:hypothetical protein
MAKRDTPAMFMQVVGGKLSPSTAFDQEQLDQLPRGIDLEVSVKHRKRSNPQNNLYWAILAEVVKATGKWPTSKHMHREIKLALGYVEKIVNKFNGAVTYQADSTAFDEMPDDEYKVFFDKAMELIAREIGIDPLDEYEARKTA